MTDSAIMDIVLQTMLIAAKLSAPMLVTSLVVGFAISLFQSVTQIQEQTLSFVPKVAAVGVAILITGNWMLHSLEAFTQEMFLRVPDLLS
jgi:flagellar biosynthetic protein FliQ